MTSSEPVFTEIKPDDPALLVKLQAGAPIKEVTPSGYKRHDDWTLDLLERTAFEFRAAGGFDKSKVVLSYAEGGSIECEILAGRGRDAMPWGWRPISEPIQHETFGPPDTLPGQGPKTIYDEPKLELPWFLLPFEIFGNRYVHGFLLMLTVLLVCFK